MRAVRLIILVVGSLVISRVALKYYEGNSSRRVSTNAINIRVNEFKEKFQYIDPNMPVHFILGNSEIEMFFNGKKFDQHIHHLGIQGKSYNLGFRGVHIGFMKSMLEWIFTENKWRKKNIDTIIVKLPLTRLTEAYELSGQQALYARDLEYIWKSSFEQLLYSPSVFLLGHSASTLRYIFLNDIREANKSYKLNPRDKFTLFYEGNWQHKGNFWTLENQGLPHVHKNLDRFNQAIAYHKEEDVWQFGQHFFEKCCGARALFFSSELVSELLDTLMIAKKISRRVIVYDYAYSPDLEGIITKQKQERLETLYKMIEQVPGVELINLRDIKLTREHYFDAIHLNESGYEIIYKVLAERIFNRGNSEGTK